MITNTPLIPKLISSKSEGLRIAQVFLDSDCRLMIPGLVKVCENAGIKVASKDYGSLIIFINTKRTYIKVLACNNSLKPVLGCYRLEDGKVYDLRVVQEIPRAFGNYGEIDIHAAITLALKKKLGMKEKEK